MQQEDKGEYEQEEGVEMECKERKRCSDIPTGDGDLGGSAFDTEVQESIRLKLNGYIGLTTPCLAMIGTQFPLNVHELFEDKGA